MKFGHGLKIKSSKTYKLRKDFHQNEWNTWLRKNLKKKKSLQLQFSFWTSTADLFLLTKIQKCMNTRKEMAIFFLVLIILYRSEWVFAAVSSVNMLCRMRIADDWSLFSLVPRLTTSYLQPSLFGIFLNIFPHNWK